MKKATKSLNNMASVLGAEKTILFPMFGIKRLGIFGSYARGEQHRDSDLDLIVELFSFYAWN